jgi:hypothetical protein
VGSINKRPKPRQGARKLHIAVVWTGRPSQRGSGGFECWVGTDKAVVIGQAVAAKNRWSNPPPFGTAYRVLVGQLTEEAAIPIRYELGHLEPFDGDV